MAVLTAQGISAVALELLSRRLALPRTVSNVPGTEFVGPNGGTVTVRVPQPGSSLTQASAGDPLTAADVSEVPVDVALSHVYHLKNITDQELSYQLENFARQVTKVQVDAVARGAEDKLAAVMNALTADASINFAATKSDADTEGVILAVREFLGDADCPPDNRYCAVSPDIATRILSVDNFVRADASGSTDALRNAVIGKLYGFTFVESNALDAGTLLAYHSSGFVFANRAPAQPKGATSSSVSASQGISLRQVFQYDAAHAQDQSLLSTMAGAAAVYENESGTDNARWVKVGVGT